MKKILVINILLLISVMVSAQQGSTDVILESPGTPHTKLQLATYDWSGTHAFLFNAYKNATVSGNLGVTGNTKYATNPGSYSSGAGSIMFYGNSGSMDFNISPESTGINNDINWGIPKLRILRDGKVGIGTISPVAKLSVEGGDLQVSHMGHFKGWTSTGLTGLGLDVGISGAVGHIMAYDRTNSQYHDMRITARGGANKGLYLSTNGNFGLDNDTPTHKLSVNGSVRTKEIICDNNDWPDYVFTDDYNLKSLIEVSQFISKNGHLPNIPSAKEVEANGIELGKMNASLLEKIEELTLYTIDQQEEISIQQLKLARQENKISDQETKLKTQESLIQSLIERIEKLEK